MFGSAPFSSAAFAASLRAGVASGAVIIEAFATPGMFRRSRKPDSDDTRETFAEQIQRTRAAMLAREAPVAAPVAPAAPVERAAPQYDSAAALKAAALVSRAAAAGVVAADIASVRARADAVREMAATMVTNAVTARDKADAFIAQADEDDLELLLLSAF